MHDQASRLRSLMRRPSWPAQADGDLPRILTVAGGKRGVGCTTLAANIAGAVAQQGWRTVLVDADRAAPQLANYLSLTPRATLDDVVSGRCDIHEALCPVAAGVHLVAGAALPAEADAKAGAPLAHFAALARHADLLVLDVGSATDGWTTSLWNEAERVLLVTAPDAAAIMECYATVKSVWRKGMGAAVQVLVNRTSDVALAADVHERLDRSCRRFLGLALEPGPAMPEDACLARLPASVAGLGCNQPAPVGPTLERLADALINPAVALSRRPAA